MKIAKILFPCFNPYNKSAIEIYVSGCKGYLNKNGETVHCKNCHNPQLWNFNQGKKFDYSTLCYIRERSDLFECISFLGGEPLDGDLEEFEVLIKFLRQIFDDKEFWLFSRYELTDIPKFCKDCFDYIKVGRYLEEFKQEGFPASSNQKLLKKGLNY